MANAGSGPVTCPAGHDSASTDFCDVCGMRIGAPASRAEAPPGPPGPATGQPGPDEAQPGPAVDPCPQCGAARSGRFCESCGFDFDSGTGPAASRPAADPAGRDGSAGRPAASGRPDPAGDTGGWTVVVGGDRAYYDSVIATGGPDAGSIQFPPYCPERRFRLIGPEMRIGRRSASRGIEPEIDLTGPPADPGVSRLHAVLVAEPDGGWTVLDPGSENGLMVNGTEAAAGVPVRLADGDRIHLGAWTVITIHAG